MFSSTLCTLLFMTSEILFGFVKGQFGDENLSWQKLSSPSTSSSFGTAATISSDDETVFISDPANDGIVYIYQKSDTVDSSSTEYTLLQSLEPNQLDFVENAQFGYSLSLDRSDNTNKLAVGARNDNTGAVYIFDRDEQTGLYVQTHKLYPIDTDEDYEFGYSVSLYNNVLAVGCGHGYGFRKSWIFKYDETTNEWSETLEIDFHDYQNDDDGFYFGTSVSVYDDTIVIGTGSNDNGALVIILKSDENYIPYPSNIIEDTIELGYPCVSIYDDIIIATGSNSDFNNMLVWDKNGNNNIILSSESGASLQHDTFGKSCDNKNNIIMSGSMFSSGKAQLFFNNNNNNEWQNEIELKPDDGFVLLWGLTVAIGNDCVVSTAFGQSAHIICGISQGTDETMVWIGFPDNECVCDTFYDDIEELNEWYYENTVNNEVYNHLLTTVDSPTNVINLGYEYIGVEGFVWKNEIDGVTFPLYRHYSTVYQDHYYTMASDTLSFENYEKKGISGYIMKQYCSEFNQPLYEYWSESKGDHLYNTDFTQLEMGDGDYEYQRIVGYVAK